jgi:hypothetical protein
MMSSAAASRLTKPKTTRADVEISARSPDKQALVGIMKESLMILGRAVEEKKKQRVS